MQNRWALGPSGLNGSPITSGRRWWCHRLAAHVADGIGKFLFRAVEAQSHGGHAHHAIDGGAQQRLPALVQSGRPSRRIARLRRPSNARCMAGEAVALVDGFTGTMNRGRRFAARFGSARLPPACGKAKTGAPKQPAANPGPRQRKSAQSRPWSMAHSVVPSIMKSSASRQAGNAARWASKADFSKVAVNTPVRSPASRRASPSGP